MRWRCVIASLTIMIFLATVLCVYRPFAFVFAKDEKQASDQEYAESLDYLKHRMMNQAWVSQTNGSEKPENAVHFGSMPIVGQVHMHMTRLLFLFSSIAEKHHVRWTIMAGTLLGYLRHGDFIPHDHDVDVVVDEINFELRIDAICHNEHLPKDLSCTFFNRTRFLGPWHNNVFIIALQLMDDGHPSCCGDPQKRSRPCVYLDIWAYNTSRGDFGWWEQPPELNMNKPRHKVMLGPSVAYIPDRPTIADHLSLILCWEGGVNQRGVRDALTGRSVFLTQKWGCHGFMHYSPRPAESRQRQDCHW
jgi:hypothetical protein